MEGPKAKGHWTKHIRLSTTLKIDALSPGYCYAVVKEFYDYDNSAHSVGEKWICLGNNYSPYDDGLSLFVSLDGVKE